MQGLGKDQWDFHSLCKTLFVICICIYKRPGKYVMVHPDGERRGVGEGEAGRMSQLLSFGRQGSWQTNHEEPRPSLPAALWREKNLFSLPRRPPAWHPGGTLNAASTPFLHKLKDLLLPSPSSRPQTTALEQGHLWCQPRGDFPGRSQKCVVGQCHALSWQQALITRPRANYSLCGTCVAVSSHPAQREIPSVRLVLGQGRVRPFCSARLFSLKDPQPQVFVQRLGERGNLKRWIFHAPHLPCSGLETLLPPHLCPHIPQDLGLQDLSSLTRDWTLALNSEIVES